MKCAWNELLRVLPQSMQHEVDSLGKESLQELRLRLGQPAQMVAVDGYRELGCRVTRDHLHFVVNTASRYSPWTAASTASGYITAPGGHRIGIVGECICQDGRVTGIRNVSSLCVRVARDFPGITEGIPKRSSLLILGPPGSGKTTLLRDLIRRISNDGSQSISVVDERGELFPPNAPFSMGRHTDVLTGCDKASGLDMALRTMGPSWIAVDEITSESDCRALLQAGWCGVRLLATAHAATAEDLMTREIYKPLVQTGLFEHIVVLQKDKSWRLERMRK